MGDNKFMVTEGNSSYQPGWSMYLILAGIVTTLGLSLPVGYNIGVVNTPAETIKSFCLESMLSHYGIVLDDFYLDILWSFIVSSYVISGCIGSISGAWFANYFGRKGACIVISIQSLVGALIFVLSKTANSFEMLLLGRLIVGMSGGLTTSILPMYLAELAPLKLTGAMGVVCPLGVNFGVFIAQVMGLQFLLGGAGVWPYLLSAYGVLVVICIPLLFFLPESPKYLYVVKRDEVQAIRDLSKIRGVPSSILHQEISLLSDESRTAGDDTTSAWTLRRMICDEKLRLPLLLVCSMQAGQQLSGINAVFNYSTSIFRNAGLSPTSSEYATIGAGFINCCTAITIIFILNKFGRKRLLLVSIGIAFVTLVCLTITVTFILSFSWMPYLCVVAVLSYVFVYGIGLGPIPYFIASEMFDVSARPTAMALGSLANWAGNFLVSLSFPTLQRTIGPFCFLMYALLTGGLFIFQKKYFLETHGKTAVEVQEIYENRSDMTNLL